MGKGLALGVAVGRTIFFDKIPMSVVAISPKDDTITVEVEGKLFYLDTDNYTEVYPEVFVGVGIPTGSRSGMTARVLIDAPRSIKILRDDNIDHPVFAKAAC